MGAHYSLGAEWQTSNDYFAYTFTYNFGVQEIPKDTLSSQQNLDGNFSIPEKMTFGVELEKTSKIEVVGI